MRFEYGYRRLISVITKRKRIIIIRRRKWGKRKE